VVARKVIGEIRKFVAGVLRHWHPLLTGGIFAVFILLWEHNSRTTISWEWTLRIIFTALGVACYLTWRGEYRRRVAAESALGETGAHLTGSIDAAYYREGATKPGNPSKRDIDIYVKSTIVNKSSTPITIRDYEINLSRAGNHFTGYLRKDYSKWRLKEEGREGDFDVDTLEKLKQNPLKQGIQKEMWTLFKVTGFDLKSLTDFTLTLSITDAFDKEHKIGPAPSSPWITSGVSLIPRQ
jgi:hypothetical protein